MNERRGELPPLSKILWLRLQLWWLRTTFRVKRWWLRQF